jgi:hypothetical protein
MFTQPLKLGVAAGVGYALGGKLGAAALMAVKKDASADAVTGAVWGGRIATFFVAAAILTRF